MATAASCVRTYYIFILVQESTHYSWEVFPSYVASHVEINLGVVSDCDRGLISWFNGLLDLRVCTAYSTIREEVLSIR